MKNTLTIVIIFILMVVGYVFLSGADKTEQVEPADLAPESSDLTTEVPAADEGGIVEEMVDEEGREAPTVVIDSFNFGYSVKEIRVNEGDTVTIELTNSEGFHDWVIDEFSAATIQIKEGETTSVTFVADQKGSFEYYCSVGSHRAMGMVGNLIVE